MLGVMGRGVLGWKYPQMDSALGLESFMHERILCWTCFCWVPFSCIFVIIDVYCEAIGGLVHI